MDGEEFEMMLLLLLKLRKNSQSVKKERRFWITKIVERRKRLGGYFKLCVAKEI